MRIIFAFLSVVAALAAQPDPREIVLRSLEADEKNWEISQDYTFLERVEKLDLNRDGEAKKRDIKTFDVTLLEGSTYRRLVERNDKPLSSVEEAAEQERLETSIERRHNESPKERARRIRQYEKKQNENRAAIKEIPDAFNFRLLGEEVIESRPAYVIEATPKPRYRHKDHRAKLLKNLKGKLWIDKADYNWVRVEAELIKNVSFGWILVRVAKGAKVSIINTKLNDEVWLPRRLWFTASARIGLIKLIRVEQENKYRDFRKFQTQTKITSMTEIPQSITR